MILTPLVGIPLQLVVFPIYVGIGCYAAHETTKGQAIGGTLIGYLIWYILFLGSVAAAYEADLVSEEGELSTICGIEMFTVRDGRITEVWNAPAGNGSWG